MVTQVDITAKTAKIARNCRKRATLKYKIAYIITTVSTLLKNYRLMLKFKCSHNWLYYF